VRRDDDRLDAEITEAEVEEAGDEEAVLHGALVVKGAFRGRRSWPDKFYFFPGARLLLVEYKRPGEEARKDQESVHRKLRRRGFQVCVVDDKEVARETIRRFVRGETVDREACL
jgi:hypothetical protein